MLKGALLNNRYMFRVALEMLDVNGRPEESVILDFYPESKEEAIDYARKYPILVDEQVAVYEYADVDGRVVPINIDVIKKKTRK